MGSGIAQDLEEADGVGGGGLAEEVEAGGEAVEAEVFQKVGEVVRAGTDGVGQKRSATRGEFLVDQIDNQRNEGTLVEYIRGEDQGVKIRVLIGICPIKGRDAESVERETGRQGAQLGEAECEGLAIGEMNPGALRECDESRKTEAAAELEDRRVGLEREIVNNTGQ